MKNNGQVMSLSLISLTLEKSSLKFLVVFAHVICSCWVSRRIVWCENCMHRIRVEGLRGRSWKHINHWTLLINHLCCYYITWLTLQIIIIRNMKMSISIFKWLNKKKFILCILEIIFTFLILHCKNLKH